MCPCAPVLAQGRDTFRLFCNLLKTYQSWSLVEQAQPCPDTLWWSRLLTLDSQWREFPPTSQTTRRVIRGNPPRLSLQSSSLVMSCPMRLHHDRHGMECLRCHSSPLGSQDWSSGCLSFIETRSCKVENRDLEKTMKDWSWNISSMAKFSTSKA